MPFGGHIHQTYMLLSEAEDKMFQPPPDIHLQIRSTRPRTIKTFDSSSFKLPVSLAFLHRAQPLSLPFRTVLQTPLSDVLHSSRTLALL
jgi:hypothetical protein